VQSQNESERVRHTFICGVIDELDHVSRSQRINCQGQPLKAGNDGSLSRCKVVDENHSLEVSRKFTHSIADSGQSRGGPCVKLSVLETKVSQRQMCCKCISSIIGTRAFYLIGALPRLPLGSSRPLDCFIRCKNLHYMLLR